MITKKICMVGAFAVGKTSLVKQFVESIFGEKYHTTIGVKIDKRLIKVETTELELMIWDIEGVDIFTELKPSYLRGASGVFIVVDSTRPNSLDVAIKLRKIIDASIPQTKLVLLLNKCDLIDIPSLPREKIDLLEIPQTNQFSTSAKTGANVEAAFQRLSQLLLTI